MWNVILYKFDFLIYCQIEFISIFLDVFDQPVMSWSDRCFCHTFLNQWRFWQMLFALRFVMADVIAIVAYIYHCIYMWKIAPH